MVDIGFRLELIVMFWVVVVAAVVAVGSFVIARKRRDPFLGEPSLGWMIPGVFSAVTALIVAVVLAVLAFPYQPKYFSLWQTEGTVATVSNAFVNGTGDRTDQNFVVTLDGDPTPYVLDDPRTSLLDGKDVTLRCTVEFVYQGADRYNCAIASVKG